jgi:hypothetical protein
MDFTIPHRDTNTFGYTITTNANKHITTQPIINDCLKVSNTLPNTIPNKYTYRDD